MRWRPNWREVAFDQAIELPQPWTDFRGNHHDTMPGRPVSFHAMRGISAHSNGFQTARALHLLQIVLGTVEVPGGYRFKPPYPKPVEAHPTPHFVTVPPASRCPARIWAMSAAPNNWR